MTTDYIRGLEVEIDGAIVPVSQENYRSIIWEHTYTLRISEDDKEITKKRIEELAREWNCSAEKSREFFFELNEKANHLSENIKEDEATIKKCENTINLIKTFAKIRGWE